MDNIEKSSNMRFVALAVADMLFCLVYFSTLVVPLKPVRNKCTITSRVSPF